MKRPTSFDLKELRERPVYRGASRFAGAAPKRSGFWPLRPSESTSEAGYLLISDLKMPVMRGTELVARLRGELGLAELPAFILSSSDSMSDIEDALCSGANGYILKCESEADYLDVVRWLEDCCCQIERGHSLTNETYFSAGRPPQVIAGPVAYRNFV